MYVNTLLRKRGLELYKKYFEVLSILLSFFIVRVFIVIKYLIIRKSVINRTVKIFLIWLSIQTDFPEYSQNHMPDNQTVSHSQSLFRKIIFIFQLWFHLRLNNFLLKHKISEQQINPKCCQSPVLAIIMEIPKTAKIVYLFTDKYPPLGSYPHKSPPPSASSKFWGLSGSEDRGGGDNSVQFINFGRVGDKSFEEWRQKIGGGRVGGNNILTFSSYCTG